MDKQTKSIDFDISAAGVFAAHPSVNRFYFTSDGQGFEIESHAIYHSKKLLDKSITDVYNPKMNEAEITEFKANDLRERQAGADASFERTFPELERNIKNKPQNPR
jgi:hypothetical protein